MRRIYSNFHIESVRYALASESYGRDKWPAEPILKNASNSTNVMVRIAENSQKN